MNNYSIVKEKISINSEIELGKDLNISINKRKISIYNIELQKVYITKRVYKKYLELLRLVNFYLNSDDETGTAYYEALNEIERFRQLVKNKYRNFLLDKTLQEMSKELTRKVKIAKNKYLYIQETEYNYNNKRSK